jgi:hypothetical protein
VTITVWQGGAGLTKRTTERLLLALLQFYQAYFNRRKAKNSLLHDRQDTADKMVYYPATQLRAQPKLKKTFVRNSD